MGLTISQSYYTNMRKIIGLHKLFVNYFQKKDPTIKLSLYIQSL